MLYIALWRILFIFTNSRLFACIGHYFSIDCGIILLKPYSVVMMYFTSLEVLFNE